MSAYLNGWLAGGSPRENRPGTYTVGFLAIDTDALADDSRTVTGVMVTGPSGFTFLVDLENDFEVTANQPFDFEAGATVPLTVTLMVDGVAEPSETLNLLIRNVDEAPSGLVSSAFTVDENAAAGVVVGSIEGLDPDAGDTSFTYELAPGQDRFELVGNEIRVRAGAELDFETRTSHDISIRVSDGGTPSLFTDVTVTIAVANVNEAPSTPVFSGGQQAVAENAVGSLVGRLAANDPEMDPITWTVVSGGDVFEIVNGDELRVKTGANLDFEPRPSEAVMVRATSAGGLFSEAGFTVAVTDVNDAPTNVALTNATIAENSMANSVVGMLSTTDQDAGDSFTYSLTGGSSLFRLIGSNLVVNFSNTLNHETVGTHSVTLRTTDAGGLFFERDFTITVTDVDEAPTGLATTGFRVNFNAVPGTTVATLQALDPDANESPAVFELVNPSDEFEIVGNTLQVKAGATLGPASFFNLDVRVVDGDVSFLSVENSVRVDVNNTPNGVTLLGTTIAEDVAPGTVIGTITGIDTDSGDTTTVEVLTSGFEVVNGELRVATSGSLLDHDTHPTVTVQFRVTDSGGLHAVFDETITVTGVDEAPDRLADTTFSVAENSVAGTVIGMLEGLDPDAGESGSVQYTLQNGTELFTLVGAELRVATGAVLDREAAPEHTVTVRLTDGDNSALFRDVTFTVDVTDVNEGPAAPSLSGPLTVNENALSGVVGTLTAADPENDPVTFTLLTGTTQFEIVGNELRVRSGATLDHEGASTVSVTVQAESLGGFVSSEDFDIAVTDVNENPTDITLSSSTVAENAAAGAAVGMLGWADPDDGEVVSFSIDGGSDDFEIIGNELRVKDGAVLDFEGVSSRSIDITATDQGGLTRTESFVITITDVNEAPGSSSLAASTIAEDAQAGTVVGVLSATDPEGSVVTLDVVDDARFIIVGSELRVASGASFDHETEASIDVTVRASDGVLSRDTVHAITVTNVQEVPTGLTLSSQQVNENSVAGTVVGTLTGQDPEGGPFTYSLVGNPDGFQILGSQLRVAPSAGLDHEAATSRNITIRVTDAQNNSTEFVRSIAIANVNEAPTGLVLSHYSAPESLAEGAVVATLDGSDPEGGALTYTLVSGTGLSIHGNELRVATGQRLDFETNPSIDAIIRVTDAGGLSTGFIHTITVIDAPDAPDSLSLSSSTIAEDAAAGSVIGTLSATDPDGGAISFGLVSSPGFEIDGNELRLAPGTSLDHEAAPQRTVTIRATDAQGNTADFTRTINISNVNEAPTSLSLPTDTVAENALGGTIVGALSAQDPDLGGSLSYSIVGADSRFEIDGNTLRVKAGAVLDHEAATSHDVTIRVTDQGGLSREEVFTIAVTDVNEVPSDITLDNGAILENAAAGTAIGAFSATDADVGAILTYSIVGADSRFEIDGNTLRVKAGAVLDHEAASSHDVTIRVTDQDGLLREEVFAITIGNVNEVPTSLALSDQAVDENAAAGTSVGVLSTTDPDTPDSFTYSIVGADTRFEIDGSTLRVKAGAVLNHEAATSHDVTIRVTDQGGLLREDTFTIAISDVNEVPQLAAHLGATSIAIPENAEPGREVGRFVATDPDGGDVLSLSLTGPDAASFTIDGDRIRLSSGASLDHETDPSLSVTLRVQDSAGLFTTLDFTVNLIDVLETTPGEPTPPLPVGSYAGLHISITDDGPTLVFDGGTLLVAPNTQYELADGIISFGADTTLGTIEHLHLILLGRPTTGTERMEAAERIENGETLRMIAQDILESEEFAERIDLLTSVADHTQLTDAQFVEFLYDAMGSPVDSGGLAFWTAGMSEGVARAEVVLGFAGSSEAADLYDAQTEVLWAVDKEALLIRSVYEVALGREPDAEGLAFWLSGTEAGMPLLNLAQSFVNSDEFQDLIANNPTAHVVERFYALGLDRASDPDGLAFWTADLDAGRVTWAEVIVLFASSPEQMGQFDSYRSGDDLLL